MRFRLISVIWGEKFVNSFLRLTLRSLMAPGNLSDINSKYKVEYTVHTTLADAERIQKNIVYLQLSKLVKFDFQIFQLSEIHSENPNSHWNLWKREINKVCDADECVITIAPDHLFSRGTLSRWFVFFEQGFYAVFTPGIQVVQETILSELEIRFQSGTAIDVDEYYFKKLMFEHLHPVTITMFRDSPSYMNHPEYHLLAIPGVGFIQKILTSHAVAFRPAEIKMDDNFRPTEKFDRIVFDACRFLSAEPLLKLLPSYYRQCRKHDFSLSHFGSWANTYMAPVNWLESELSHTYTFASNSTSKDLKSANLGAQAYVKQLRNIWATYRLWLFLRQEGLYQAARLLAAWQILYRLSQRIAIPEHSTVFILCNQALDRLPNNSLRNLLFNKGINLIAEFREYISLGRHQLTVGDHLEENLNGSIKTISGKSYKQGKIGARILRGPLMVDGLQIYVIDKPLGLIQIDPPQIRALLLSHLRGGIDIVMRTMNLAQKALIKLLRTKLLIFQLVISARHKLVESQKFFYNFNFIGNVKVSPSSKLLFEKAVNLSALKSILELYSFYQDHVLCGSNFIAAPALWVSEAIGLDNIDSVTLLETAVLKDPSFSEAWLELGSAFLDSGKPKEALSALKAAQKLQSTLIYGPKVFRTQDIASLLLIELFLKMDLVFDDELSRLKPTSNRNMGLKANLLYGKLLLHQGKEQAALLVIEKCIIQNHITKNFVMPLPNRLSEILKSPPAVTLV